MNNILHVKVLTLKVARLSAIMDRLEDDQNENDNKNDQE